MRAMRYAAFEIYAPRRGASNMPAQHCVQPRARAQRCHVRRALPLLTLRCAAGPSPQLASQTLNDMSHAATSRRICAPRRRDLRAPRFVVPPARRMFVVALIAASDPCVLPPRAAVRADLPLRDGDAARLLTPTPMVAANARRCSVAHAAPVAARRMRRRRTAIKL